MNYVQIIQGINTSFISVLVFLVCNVPRLVLNLSEFATHEAELEEGKLFYKNNVKASE